MKNRIITFGINKYIIMFSRKIALYLTLKCLIMPYNFISKLIFSKDFIHY